MKHDRHVEHMTPFERAGEMVYHPDLCVWGFLNEDGSCLIYPFDSEAEAAASRDEYFRDWAPKQ